MVHDKHGRGPFLCVWFFSCHRCRRFGTPSVSLIPQTEGNPATQTHNTGNSSPPYHVNTSSLSLAALTLQRLMHRNSEIPDSKKRHANNPNVLSCHITSPECTNFIQKTLFFTKTLHHKLSNVHMKESISTNCLKALI